MKKKPKYQISYTLKDPSKPGFRREEFPTKTQANSWLKKHKDSLYWHQLTEINPKSKLPKPIIGFEPGQEYEMKQGTLQTYFETGMESLGLVFYEDGVYGGPNPDFDPSKPESRSNFKFYASYDGLHFLQSGQILQIENGPKIGIVKDRDFASRDGYRLGFYPQGFSRLELLSLFGKETVKAKLWIKKVPKKEG